MPLRDYYVGETLKLRPNDPEATLVTFTLPDGALAPVSIQRGAVAKLMLPQAGTWRYFWSEDDQGEFQVLTPEPPPSTEPRLASTLSTVRR